MSEHNHETEPLPEGRVTNRQVAELVEERIRDTRDTFRAELRAARAETRIALISIVAMYQLHLNLGVLGGAAVAYIGWTHVLPRFRRV